MSGTWIGTTLEYLLGYIEGTDVRSSEVWKDWDIDGLEIGFCVGQIFGPLLGIRKGYLIG